MKNNPGITDNQRQTATTFGCGIALVALVGVGMIGKFIKDDLGWGWIILLSGLLLFGIGALTTGIQTALESGGGGSGGRDDENGGGTPEPDPKPRSRMRIPDAWPPDPSL